MAFDKASGPRGLLMALGALTLCLAWLLPGHYHPWTAFQSELLATVAGLLFIAAAWGLRGAAVPPMSWLALGLAVLPLFQFLAGRIPLLDDALLPALYLLGFALAMHAGRCLAAHDRTELHDALGIALLAGSLISVALATAQWLGLQAWFVVDHAPGGRPSANLAQPNHVATLLAMGLMAVLRWFETRRIAGLSAVLLALPLGWGLVMAQSRTTWLFAGLFVAVWLVLRTQASLRLSGRTIVIALAVFVMASLAWGPLNQWLHGLSVDVAATRVAVPGGRTAVWPILWDAVWRQPWLGYGWNQDGWALQTAALDHPAAYENYNHAHNLALSLAIWLGVPLAAMVLLALAAWAWRRVRACRDASDWAALIMVGTVFAHAMVEYPLHYSYFLLPVALLMGTLEPIGQSIAQRARVGLALQSIGLATLASLSTWIALEYLHAEPLIRTARFISARVGLDQVSQVPEPDVTLLQGPLHVHRILVANPRPGMSNSELEALRVSARRYPYPYALYRYATAAGLNGQPEQASLALARLCRIHVPQRCDEARMGWAEHQDRHETLRQIPFPPAAGGGGR